MVPRRLFLVLLPGVVLGLLACGAPAAVSTPVPGATVLLATPSHALTAVPTATALPGSPPTATRPPTAAAPATTPTRASPATPGGPVRLELGQGTVARYLVKEQLAGANLPNDAVGSTTAVRGQLVLAGGSVQTAQGEESRFTVDLTTLRSDDSRRDNYVRRNTLDTARFPNAEFVLREARGLAAPLPSSGPAQFQLVGDMTVHGVTSSVVWAATATFTGGVITGKATTSFPFSQFGMEIPRVFLVVSLEDNIRLELDFRLAPAG